MIDSDELREHLEKYGLKRVRIKLADGVFGDPNKPIVEEWIASKEREQNEMYRRVTMYAAIVTAFAVFISAGVAIFSLFPN